jgi:glyoxylase-like metal-dependent hydrolase (beta-lactamase superfamily II)
MKYLIIPVTAFQQNCSLIWCQRSGRGAVVDPGGDLPQILSSIERLHVEPESILLTHGHADHVAGAADLSARLDVPIVGPHHSDQFWLDALPEQTEMFGLPLAQAFTPSRWLEDGDTVAVGEELLQVIHCPGHTPGHVVFFHRPSQLAIVGDVLFQGSVGRTDFPRGDHATLLRSIRTRLLPLGDTVSFIPGHGPMSTFGSERLHNPFLT